MNAEEIVPDLNNNNAYAAETKKTNHNNISTYCKRNYAFQWNFEIAKQTTEQSAKKKTKYEQQPNFSKNCNNRVAALVCVSVPAHLLLIVLFSFMLSHFYYNIFFFFRCCCCHFVISQLRPDEHFPSHTNFGRRWKTLKCRHLFFFSPALESKICKWNWTNRG